MISYMDYNFLFNVRCELNLRNMTRKTLSDKTGIPLSTINGWYSKNLTPDVISAYKVANVLDVSLDYLVSGKEREGYEVGDIKILKELKTLPDQYKKVVNNLIDSLNGISTEITDGDNYIFTEK